MSKVEVLPVIPDKPRCGDPCNGCGLCCYSEVCPVGKMAFGDVEAPCLALVMSKDMTRTRCGLVLIEIDNDMGTQVQEAIGVGCGCSMDDDVECISGDHFWSDPVDGFSQCSKCFRKSVE